MQKLSTSHIISIGLAIFSMLFGAGNLMYPILVGMTSGTNTFWGMTGFILTAILLPLAGLVAMILFDGNYQTFFKRLGEIPGEILIFLCMIIIGPGLVIPRIVTLSHTMTAPFLPGILSSITPLSSFIFAILFLGITFLATFRENRIVDLLGYVISPLLLISLVTIIIKGLWFADVAIPNDQTPWELFKQNFIVGYETLDLLGTIFFSSIVIQILKNTIGGNAGYSLKQLAMIGFKAGTIGVSLLALVYIGMSGLGMYYGAGLEEAHAGELFREVSFRVLGGGGAAVIALAVLMACLSTSIALSAVCSEYLQRTIFKNKVDYVTALIITLVACIPLCVFGLEKVLALTAGPLVYVGYPVIIAITLCNIAYKLFGFKPIKLPVLVTFIVAAISYYGV